MNRTRYGRLGIRLILVLSILFAAVTGAAAEPERIAVVPFKINAEKDMAFLRNGIFDMLFSRLTDPGRVEVLDRGAVDAAAAGLESPLDDAAARGVGRALDADYVVFGSLTVFGDRVSIDARLVDTAGDRPTLTFFKQAAELGDVIPAVDLFAADINAKLFGKEAVAGPAPAGAAPASPAAPPATAQPQPSAPATVQPTGPRNGGYIIREEAPVGTGGGFWKSRNYDFALNGVAVGDVDDDGRPETVLVGSEEILIYRMQAGRLAAVARPKQPGFRYVLGVDAADINGNGTAEIFITGLNDQLSAPSSYVLEYDDGGFVTRVKDSPWYYRVVQVPGRGDVLLGQQGKVGEPFGGGIFEMSWIDGEYTPGRAVDTPKAMNVMGLSMGDVRNDGQAAGVGCDRHLTLQVFDLSGSTLWTGEEKIGANSRYVLGAVEDRGQVENKLWLTAPVAVVRLPGSARSLVIAVRNKGALGLYLDRRDITKGNLQAFAWHGAGTGLTLEWKTREIDGEIRDFTVADFDADGRPELVAAVLLKSGTTVFTRAKSTLVAYELE